MPSRCSRRRRVPQRAIGSKKRKRSADCPLLPPPKRAIVTRRLWFQLDECRGSEHEEENARLKRLLAESLLDQAALKDLLSRKW